MDLIFELIHQFLYIKIGKKQFGQNFGEDSDKTQKWQTVLFFFLVLAAVVGSIILIFRVFLVGLKYFGPI